MRTEYLDKLNQLKNLLQETSEFDSSLEALLSRKGVPVDSAIVNLLTNSSLINKEFPFAFLGYEAVDASYVLNTFNIPGDKYRFFGGYEYDQGLTLREDMAIYLENDFDHMLAESAEILDISKFVPLMEFQGDYIVADMGGEFPGRILTIMDGHNASNLAPSLISHIDDLISGISNGVYRVNEEQIMYPGIWYQRARVQSGEAKLDEYGEYVESR
jgi:hypothetical protein